VPAGIARLIAAHLYRGPESALHRFVVDGSLSDRLFDELDEIHSTQPRSRAWVQGLAGYCLSRGDYGPLSAWQPTAMSGGQPDGPAVRGRNRNSIDRGSRSGNRGPLMDKRIPTETVMALVDAAYTLGLSARRLGLRQLEQAQRA
jgi:hypothetical protein